MLIKQGSRIWQALALDFAHVGTEEMRQMEDKKIQLRSQVFQDGSCTRKFEKFSFVFVCFFRSYFQFDTHCFLLSYPGMDYALITQIFVCLGFFCFILVLVFCLFSWFCLGSFSFFFFFFLGFFFLFKLTIHSLCVNDFQNRKLWNLAWVI